MKPADPKSEWVLLRGRRQILVLLLLLLALAIFEPRFFGDTRPAGDWHHVLRTTLPVLALVGRRLLRAPFVQLRHVWQTPTVLWPTVVGAAFIGLAWMAQIRSATGKKRERALEIIGVALGVAMVLWFFRLGQLAWDQNADWQKELTYGTALKEAVLRHEMPYYLRTQFQGTERYLANLETLVAPDALLLSGMSVATFFVVHAILVLCLGCYGLVLLERELALSSFSWAVFLTIFLLNGHITSHLGTGHTQWVAYFLLPWVLLCLAKAARGDRSTRNAAILALSLSAMIMIGGWHVFVWSFLFVLFFCLTSLARLTFLARVSVMTACLSTFRLLPALITFGGGSNSFLGSYRQLWVLAAALVGDPRSNIDGLDWWEYDVYVGYVGFLMLCLALTPARDQARRFINQLIVPSLALLALSMYDLYAYTFFRLPGFVSERVATRLVILPVLALTLIGCVRMDEWRIWQARRPTFASVSALIAGWLLIVELVPRAEGVRPASAVTTMPIATNVLKAVPIERAYYWSVWIGAAVSVMALTAIVLRLARQEKITPSSAERSV